MHTGDPHGLVVFWVPGPLKNVFFKNLNNKFDFKRGFISGAKVASSGITLPSTIRFLALQGILAPKSSRPFWPGASPLDGISLYPPPRLWNEKTSLKRSNPMENEEASEHDPKVFIDPRIDLYIGA